MENLRAENSPELNEYLAQLLGPNEGLFLSAKKKAEEFGKAAISVSAVEGNLLRFFTSLFGCQRVVEIGALTGYSSLWLLKAIGREGKLHSFELDPAHARAARGILQSAVQQWWPEGPRPLVEVIEGDARFMLEEFARGLKGEKIDGIFIDGNKGAYLDYLLWAEKNLRAGGLVLADNIFLRGEVYLKPGHFSAKQVEVMREFNQRLSNPKLYDAIPIPTAEGLFVARFLGN